MTTNLNLMWFEKMFMSISHDKDVYSCLSDIKVVLIGLNTEELKLYAENLFLNPLFDCLYYSSSDEQIELGCDVLKALLSVQKSTTVFKRYAESMIVALCHPKICVKELMWSEFNRAATDVEEWQELMLNIVEYLAHEDTEVSQGSIQFFVRLGNSDHGLATVYSKRMLEAFDSVMRNSDDVRYRVYEIAVDISINSKPGLEASQTCGLLNNLLNELNKVNVMVKLSALEMVTKLALCHHGYEYLEANSVIKQLGDALIEAHKDPLYILIMPELIKFFGNIGQIRPKDVFSKYVNAVKSLFNSFESNEISICCIAMETIGHIAMSPEGKQTLNNCENHMVKVMPIIMEVINNTSNESRVRAESHVRALNSLSNIIKLELKDQNNELLSITKNWFNSMGQPRDTMNKIMSLCQQPCIDTQKATLLLLQALAEQLWGQEYIANQPGLIEIILDRNVQTTTVETKTMKHNVIKALCDSPTTQQVFVEDIVQRLHQFFVEDTVQSIHQFLKEGAVSVAT